MSNSSSQIAVIGAGPAGLMAAEILSAHGKVHVFDRMASPGRKLLMAGRGGLNLTHSETPEKFGSRFSSPRMVQALAQFSPEQVIAWCEGLGQETFVGSSGRVFPRAMKASPLLRAWLARLAAGGVTLHPRHDWAGWTEDGALLFETPQGSSIVAADVTVLALGGASWPRLGSDGAWTRHFAAAAIQKFHSSNMGFTVAWSERFRRFAGTPLKRVALGFGTRSIPGEAMITDSGIEGGAIYALSADLRDAIAARGPVQLHIDLRPDLSPEALAAKLRADRGSQSLSNYLRSKAGLAPVAIGLVQEALHQGVATPLAALIKAVPVTLQAPAPIARAISSAGGLSWNDVDESFMIRDRPGVFAAGEMLDWEAPTGGYLLQGCLSTGVAAARGAVAWLDRKA